MAYREVLKQDLFQLRFLDMALNKDGFVPMVRGDFHQMVHKVLREHKVHSAPRDLTEVRVLLGLKEPLVIKEPKVLKELLVIKELRDHRDLLVIRV